jgi:hypothetical protein
MPYSAPRQPQTNGVTGWWSDRMRWLGDIPQFMSIDPNLFGMEFQILKYNVETQRESNVKTESDNLWSPYKIFNVNFTLNLHTLGQHFAPTHNWCRI